MLVSKVEKQIIELRVKQDENLKQANAACIEYNRLLDEGLRIEKELTELRRQLNEGEKDHWDASTAGGTND